MISQLQVITAKALTKLANQLGYENDTAELLKRTSDIIERKDNCIFVAKIDGDIVGWIHGFIALRIESALFVEIAGLVVDQGFRKQNIGKNLIEAVKDWSNAAGINKIRVRCNVIRTASHKFYENIGFHQNKQQMVFEMDI